MRGGGKKDVAQSSTFAAAHQIGNASFASCSTEELDILTKESIVNSNNNNNKASPLIELMGAYVDGRIHELYRQWALLQYSTQSD